MHAARVLLLHDQQRDISLSYAFRHITIPNLSSPLYIFLLIFTFHTRTSIWISSHDFFHGRTPLAMCNYNFSSLCHGSISLIFLINRFALIPNAFTYLPLHVSQSIVLHCIAIISLELGCF
ncbi:hypothetical protein BDN72DRAFT_122960 [Pluteus cervinus]|uniref:Uncharacterized protein n=1 Tax=Pluteus cervinus TaxID=181527 RepID=A0ACD3B8A2_9AGAR|nr:hypothetical protein BDN72DRAFT_122960 [Pluteus cervinus]